MTGCIVLGDTRDFNILSRTLKELLDGPPSRIVSRWRSLFNLWV